ncbi:MAG TPA: hypothetical protein VG672_17400, partial [Bryobacteraceae bacterium]|nr:hypothetical protein [Bryobacteraceae bacterium]
FSTLYGLTWTAYAIAGAIGPILMGRAFDASSSYQSFVAQLSILTLASAALMLFMPSYRTPQPETRSQPDPQNISPVFNQLPPE